MELAPDFADARQPGQRVRDRQVGRGHGLLPPRSGTAAGPRRTHCNLGNAFKDQENLDEAVSSYRRALARPDYAEASAIWALSSRTKGSCRKRSPAVARRSSSARLCRALCPDVGRCAEGPRAVGRGGCLLPAGIGAEALLCEVLYAHLRWPSRPWGSRTKPSPAAAGAGTEAGLCRATATWGPS